MSSADGGGFLPFARPDIGEGEIRAVTECLREGWLTTGTICQKFEEEFTWAVGSIYALATSSATIGFALVFRALGIEPGDEILTVGLTFSSPAMEAWHLGAVPVLVDIDPDTLNIDPARIEEAITPRTRAILVTHFAGLACDMAPIHELALAYGLQVVEDAAHALPTSYDGRRVGSLGSVATVFSFYATKTMTTGEGGMVTTDDPRLFEALKRLRLHGFDRDAFARYRDKAFGYRYDVAGPGYKANLPDILAALGRVQLARLDHLHARRQHLARRYLDGLQGLPLGLPSDAPPDETHAWHLFVVRLLAHDRDRVFAKMQARGVGCSVHFLPLHQHSFWIEHCVADPTQVVVTDQVAGQILSLPLFTRMTEADQDRVIQALTDIIQEG